jgi:hypothetical protein
MTHFKSENTLSLLAILALLSACGSESAADSSEQSDTAAVSEAPAEEAESAAFPTAELLDPNTASIDDLAAVTGMNPAAAAEIVNGRPFKTQSKMDAAIGDALDDEGRKTVYAQVFIKVGLNKGAEEDYKLIPSTMPAGKLAHEFEEYRPYESLEQFSREMSKYVSAEEVAYLGRFVTLD